MRSVEIEIVTREDGIARDRDESSTPDARRAIVETVT